MPDELILFEKMQRGDTSALEYFFREYTDVLYYRALGFVKDNLAAEDIVQEVFIRFWQLRKNLKITDSVPGYLCKADHRCHNYLEHLKVKHRYEESQKWEEVMEEVSEDEEELNIMRERLKMFVDSLPEKCREIFILACIEGLKYKQVAEKLDVSVNTVKTQLKSAYSKLRAEFNENDLEIIVLLIFLGYM
ncbi:MAG: RNA polymerase sigma-70 factor [Butyricimonas virosa]|nr:RNA polymerase sigma-70 factor [Butyricimonas virosa]